jgi:hypothetical protein
VTTNLEVTVYSVYDSNMIYARNSVYKRKISSGRGQTDILADSEPGNIAGHPSVLSSIN